MITEKNKKLISIVTPCFNEQDNIEELCESIRRVMLGMSNRFDYEHIVIDNASTDLTLAKLRVITALDKNVKVIVNARNFGPVRSPYYGVLCAEGDAVVLIASDLQDPPDLINEFVREWESGFKIVLPVKPKSEESMVMSWVRKLYYILLNKISEVPLENNATGAGLYDKEVVDCLRRINDPYPYFRGLVCDLGFRRTTIDFLQPKRKRGYSKASFYGLFDQAFLAMVKHSRLPLRLMTFLGLIMSLISLLVATFYFVLKLIYWDSFALGMAPLLIAIFFFSAIQFLFLGLLGEYVGAILTQVRKMPPVIEAERINF